MDCFFGLYFTLLKFTFYFSYSGFWEISFRHLLTENTPEVGITFWATPKSCFRRSNKRQRRKTSYTFALWTPKQTKETFSLKGFFSFRWKWRLKLCFWHFFLVLRSPAKLFRKMEVSHCRSSFGMGWEITAVILGAWDISRNCWKSTFLG